MISALIERFRPDMKMLTATVFSLFEVFPNGGACVFVVSVGLWSELESRLVEILLWGFRGGSARPRLPCYELAVGGDWLYCRIWSFVIKCVIMQRQ